MDTDDEKQVFLFGQMRSRLPLVWQKAFTLLRGTLLSSSMPSLKEASLPA